MKKLFTILIGLLFINLMLPQQNEQLVPMDISGECAVPINEKQISFTPAQLNNAKDLFQMKILFLMLKFII